MRRLFAVSGFRPMIECEWASSRCGGCEPGARRPAAPYLRRYDDSCLYLSRLFHRPPSVIRVKARHFQGDIGGAPAEVLLVDGPLMIDEERHQAGTAVSSGKGHEREPTDHVAARHIVDLAARGVRPLLGENLIVIALIGSPPLAFDGISFLCSRGAEFTERTFAFTGRCRPVEAVSFPWSADKTPCVDALTCETLLGIFFLAGDVGFTGVDRALLVAADAAVNNFRAGELRIESPSIVQAHQPDGERPAFSPDNQRGLVLAVPNDLILGLEVGEETPAHGLIVNRVAGQHDLVAAWTQHAHQLLQGIGPHCVDERRNRFVGSAVAPLR